MSVKSSESVPTLWSSELPTKSLGRSLLQSFKLTLNLPKLRQEHSFNSPSSRMMLSQLMLLYMACLYTTTPKKTQSLKPWLSGKVMMGQVSGSAHPEANTFCCCYWTVVLISAFLWLHCNYISSLHCVEESLETWTTCTQNSRNLKNWLYKVCILRI